MSYSAFCEHEEESGMTCEYCREPQEDEGCTEACAAMPKCLVCSMIKHPRGRDVGASSSFCEKECPGHNEEPHAGHLWPSEWSSIKGEK